MMTSNDFLAELGVSHNLRSIIERSAREYEATGQFVTFNTLAYEAALRDEPIDMNEVFKMPQVLGGAWTTEKVELTGLGLVEAGTAPRTAENMARLAAICGERKLAQRDDAVISRVVLVDEYGFSAEAALGAVDLVQMLPGVSGGGKLGDDWSLSIFRTALDYRKVRSVEDLRKILGEQARERLGLNNQATASFQPFAEESFEAKFTADAPSPDADASAVALVLNVQELKILERVIWEVRRAEDDAALDTVDPGMQAEIDAETRVLEAQLRSPKPKRSIVKATLKSLALIFREALGTATGGGLLAAIEEAVRHIR